MNIAIYQINPDRDENNVAFLNYENLERFQGSAELRSEIYDKVFEGEVECGTLEEVYQMFNLDHPDGYQGRSLSVSDVVEVVGEEKSTFHFCDSIGFREVDFDPDMTEPLKEKKIKVVLCEPGKVARVAEIGTELSDLQRVVGGLIEPYYPFEEQVCIVCNDEGKYNGMRPCRAIYGDDREMMDIIFGPFSSAIAARRTLAPSTRSSWNATRSSSRIRSVSFGSAGKSRPSPISPKRTTSADGGNTMKMIDDVIIIGIDSGYGNIKTANCCFPASVSTYAKEPVFKENLLVFESKFYLIGEGHKEFLADKTKDLDYYVLALAAIARELNIRKMTCGKIRIAAGLPLTWVSGQRNEFRNYLMQNRIVDFSFRNISYHVEIVGVDVFPQGFAAVADRLSDFRGVNMICDIGNGTMNIMFINDKKPVSGNMFTEKYGTHQCLLAVRENVMRAHHTTVDEAIINRVFRFGTADIKEEYLKTITDTATDYVEGIFQRLREHEYNPELMRLYVLGGGSCLIRNFGVYDASRVTINDDICATAKGYEYLAYVNLLKNGGIV